MTGSVFSNRQQIQETSRGRAYSSPNTGMGSVFGASQMQEAVRITQETAKIRALQNKKQSGQITQQELLELQTLLGEEQPTEQRESVTVMQTNSNSVMIDWTRFSTDTKYQELVHATVTYHQAKYDLNNLESTKKELEVERLKEVAKIQQQILLDMAAGKKVENIPSLDTEVDLTLTIQALNEQITSSKQKIDTLEVLGIKFAPPTVSASSYPAKKIERPAANMPMSGLTVPQVRISPQNLTDIESRNGSVGVRTSMTPEEIAMAKTRKAKRVPAGQDMNNRRYAPSREGATSNADSILEQALREQEMEDRMLRESGSDIIQT